MDIDAILARARSARPQGLQEALQQQSYNSNAFRSAIDQRSREAMQPQKPLQQQLADDVAWLVRELMRERALHAAARLVVVDIESDARTDTLKAHVAAYKALEKAQTGGIG